MHTGKSVAHELREVKDELQSVHEKLAIIAGRHDDTPGGRRASRAECALRAVLFILEHDPSDVSEDNTNYLASKLINGFGEFKVVVGVAEAQSA